jgi:hypothetical protein
MRSLRHAWPFSSILLLGFGAALVGIGIFFVALRPPLLPEDARFIGLSLDQLQAEQPRLATWLLRVFQVLGGYVAACGILVVTLAATSYRRHDWTAGLGVLVAGAASIGWMVVVNFLIASDFRWVLLAIAMLWVGSVCLFFIEQPAADRGRT